jgi:2,4-dienoyl-CoA reductase-like NADH-dependent reductase (Old Yellow Enzyme family)
MPSLSDPLTGGKLELKNRIVMPPMANDFSDGSGAVNERHLEHYRARAEADVGLMVIEHSYINPHGKMTEKQLGIHDDSLVPGLGELADTIRKAGSKSAIQITHAGANTSSDVCDCQPLGPSDVAMPGRKEAPRPMTLDEIVGLKEDYRAAARRAREAGFDAIEIHGAHGFLLCEFVSPHTNHRTDEYGGDMEGRIRLPLEVIAIVREEVGPDFPLLYRFGASDFLDDGLDLQQAREIAPRLVAAGIDILDISGGLCGSRPKDLAGIQGYFVPMAASIKSVVDVPVIGVGGITDPAFANGFIEEGKVDLVAVGRALLKNPHWAREALAQLAE